jgi:hypothetical protein
LLTGQTQVCGEGIFYIRSGIVSGGENGRRKATNGKTVRVRVREKKERKIEKEEQQEGEIV